MSYPTLARTDGFSDDVLKFLFVLMHVCKAVLEAKLPQLTLDFFITRLRHAVHLSPLSTNILALANISQDVVARKGMSFCLALLKTIKVLVSAMEAGLAAL